MTYRDELPYPESLYSELVGRKVPELSSLEWDRLNSFLRSNLSDSDRIMVIEYYSGCSQHYFDHAYGLDEEQTKSKINDIMRILYDAYKQKGEVG